MRENKRHEIEKYNQWAGREKCPLPFLSFNQWIPFWCVLFYFSGISLCSAPSVLSFCLCFPMFCFSQKPFPNPFSLHILPAFPQGLWHITSVSLFPLLSFSFTLLFVFFHGLLFLVQKLEVLALVFCIARVLLLHVYVYLFIYTCRQ